MHPNQISREIITAAMKIHTAFGPGLLEKAYERCLAYELAAAGLTVQCQVPLPVIYKEVRMEFGYRLDLIANNSVVVEIKAVEAIAPVHKAQLLSYLCLSRKPLGLLINFNVVHFKDRLKRVVNNLGIASSATSAASELEAFRENGT